MTPPGCPRELVPIKKPGMIKFTRRRALTASPLPFLCAQSCLQHYALALPLLPCRVLLPLLLFLLVSIPCTLAAAWLYTFYKYDRSNNCMTNNCCSKYCWYCWCSMGGAALNFNHDAFTSESAIISAMRLPHQSLC